jgi:hypothetical protein
MYMKQYVKSLLILLSVLFTFTGMALPDDTCEVKEYVRPDGLMIRGVSFETIYVVDSINILAAMYAIDKDYFLVIRIENIDQLVDAKNYNEDIAIQLSDSTVILLKYSSFKGQPSKNSYEGYFKISSNDLGYIEKSTIVKMEFLIKDQKIYFFIKEDKDLLQRHYACLRKK